MCQKITALILLILYKIILLKAQTQTIILSAGDSAIFHCNHSEKNINYLRWKYQPYDSGINTDLYDLKNDAVRENYEASCRFDQLFCDLKLLNATAKSAGKYKCLIGDGIKEKRSTITVFELVVGSLTCQSNIGKNHEMIGENDCKEIQPDVLKRTCLFEYHGTLNEELHFGWTRTAENATKFTEDYKIGITFTSNSIGIRDEVEVNTNMDGMMFQCGMKEFSHVKRCSLPIFNVQYVKSFNKGALIQNHESQSTNCSINKSANVECSCSWIHQQDAVQTKIDQCILSSKYIKYSGNYTCKVNCSFSSSKICQFDATARYVGELHNDNDISKTAQIIIIIVIWVIILVGISTLLICYWRKICRRWPFTEKSFVYSRWNKNPSRISSVNSSNENGALKIDQENDDRNSFILKKMNPLKNAKSQEHIRNNTLHEKEHSVINMASKENIHMNQTTNGNE